MGHDVFICHVLRDRHIADSIRATLEAGGLMCWLALRDIKPGEEWRESVERAIAECRVFVLVLSRSAAESETIKREVALAFGKGKPVVHAYAEDVAAGAIKSLGRARTVVDLWPEPAAALPVLLARVRDLVSPRPPASSGGELAAGRPREREARADADEHLDALLRGIGGRRGVGGASEPQRPGVGAGRSSPDDASAASIRDILERERRNWEQASQPRPAPPPAMIPPVPAAMPDGAAQASDVYWEKREREAGKLRSPLPVGTTDVMGPSDEHVPLPPRSFVKTFGKKLRTLTRKLMRRAADCDPVDCTVFAPPAVGRGSTFMVQVFAHRPEQARAARESAEEFDDAAARRGFTSLEAEIRRGAKLTVHLAIPDFRVAVPVRSLPWRGRVEAVQFEVEVPAEPSRETAIGTVTVSEDGVPLGHVKFKISVTEAGKARRARPTASGAALRYRKAFISYAAQDRAEVLKRVQMLARLKIKFFQDVLDLEPGARWEQQLYRHIDESDLFLLFWSGAAKQSEWVLKEVRYALARKHGDDTSPPEIIPVIIEGPPPVAPPPELAHLHFNDYLVYFIAPPGA